ncbi:MAG: hypothetical protein ACOY93_18940 [Bacillota bacterium]
MAQDRTSGFDLLVQISETELNNQVAAAAASGLFFPTSISRPVNTLGVTGQLDLNLGIPVVDLDRPRPQMGLTIPFTNSQLAITSPVPATIAPLSGTIVVVDQVQIRSTGGTQQAVMDFTSGAPTVTVTFSPATALLLTPILSGLGITLDQARAALAAQVQASLVADVQRLPLTPQIPVADDSDPITPFSIEVTTVNDTTAADRDALTFGIRTDAASGGNINGVTQSFIPAGGQSVVMMSNFWLLARVVRPRLAAELGLSAADFDTPLRLNRPVPAPGGQGTLTQLEGRVEGNRIRIDGRATASGTGWSAVATFHFFIDLSLSGGQIQITASPAVVDTDVSLEWWVWLLSLGLGALFGGIVGAIVGAIVPAIVEAVAEGLAEQAASQAFDDAVGNIPPIPLGPIGSTLTLTSLLLDDLELRGPIQWGLTFPVKSSGAHMAGGGFTLDLDAGTLHPAGSLLAKLDLAWNPATGLSTRNGAGLSVTGYSYGALTPVQLRNLSFATTHLPAASIPPVADLGFFDIGEAVVFGVRTNQGRLAKVKAWRDLLAGGALRLEWTTYDTPIPTLDIALRWEVMEKGEGTPFVGADFAACTRYTVSRRCTVEAWPRLMAFPVNYQWCLCGTVLQGQGKLQHAGGSIAYRVDGRYLTLETEMGQAVDCELCVSAVDAKSRELFTCVPLQIGPTETDCGRGRRFYPKPKLEWIPCDPLVTISRWEPVTSPLVQGQIRQAIEQGRGK